MEIKLKNIYVADRMSRETTAFDANIYIDNVKAGYASNDGQGGITNYYGSGREGRDLIEKAEKYCLTLPPKTYPATADMPEPLTVKMNLENFIDDLVMDYQAKRDLLRFNQKMEKKMANAIVFGTPDKAYRSITFPQPLELLLLHTKGEEAIKAVLLEKVLPRLGPEEKILNTNIDADTLKEMGVPEGKIVENKLGGREAGKEQKKTVAPKKKIKRKR